MDFESKSKLTDHSISDFINESCELMDQVKHLDPTELSSLMKISEKLGELNHERNQSWQTPFTLDNAKQCIYAFKGDVYMGLDAETLSKKDIQFAQKHLRILSGLYGLLKPLDLIQPYRLEMGTRFANSRGANLYQYWGNRLTDALSEELQDDATLINLASNEYSKVLQLKNIDANVITPIFKDKKNGEYKLISFYAKKARGLMSRYIITNKLTKASQIKKFDMDGYKFNLNLTKNNDWVFTREEII